MEIVGGEQCILSAVTQFKVEQEQRRLVELDAAKAESQAEIVHLQEEKTDAQKEAKEAKAGWVILHRK